MSSIRNVKLELLRSGPSHNQLLSPLTPYIALCGAESPVTINLPFEHKQLLNRLNRLRYAVKGQKIPAEQRESEVRDIEEILGRQVLGEVPTLISELSQARSEGGLIHLSLSGSALELGMVPFEFAIGADGFPATGSPLFLQSQSPIAITREVRRGKSLHVNWNRPPRILFAFASPEGLPNVPADNHLRALRRAIDPWVKWQPDEQKRCDEVKNLITILPDATLKSIAKACNKTEYTHVHILAHGAEYEQAGDKHYGVALFGDNGFSIDVVDGQRLAIALMSMDTAGNALHCPTVVNLATCDSGAVDSVITPGGSIAHALHAGGIPWVFASQFPLWMRSSTIAVEELFSGLLKGTDPRWVLFELRKRLFVYCDGTHDWAGIVAYASVPENFQQQVSVFRDRQRKAELNVKFHIADQVLSDSTDKVSGAYNLPERYENLDQLYEEIRLEHKNWLNELGEGAEPKVRAEVLGMFGAAEKRIGLLHAKTTEESCENHEMEAYRQACLYYKHAMEAEPGNHWAITQYLSMRAVIQTDKFDEQDRQLLNGIWITGKQITHWIIRSGTDECKAEALASLAELELLGVIYNNLYQDQSERKREISKLCRELFESNEPDAFIIRSTRRQFERYLNESTWKRGVWKDLAQAAVDALR